MHITCIGGIGSLNNPVLKTLTSDLNVAIPEIIIILLVKNNLLLKQFVSEKLGVMD
jgi:hypothetical protein